MTFIWPHFRYKRLDTTCVLYYFKAGTFCIADVMPEKNIAEDIAIDKAHKRKHLKTIK
jgi:hypothetical protein